MEQCILFGVRLRRDPTQFLAILIPSYGKTTPLFETKGAAELWILTTEVSHFNPAMTGIALDLNDWDIHPREIIKERVHLSTSVVLLYKNGQWCYTPVSKYYENK